MVLARRCLDAITPATAGWLAAPDDYIALMEGSAAMTREGE